MELRKIIEKVYSTYEESGYDIQKLKSLISGMDEGFSFPISLHRDLKYLDVLKKDPRFNGCVKDDKKGWLDSHDFTITLDILNRDMVPGKKVFVQPGMEKLPVVTYYALCPELENFVALINWTSSESSRNAYKQILTWIKEESNKVLQFSNTCGIRLPNEIHPGRDREAKMEDKKHYESIYNWKYAYYLTDDGDTILSHNSPINYRRVYLDAITKEETFVELRSTLGRVLEVSQTGITILIPRIDNSPRVVTLYISGREIDLKTIECNKLYSFLIFKKIGKQNVENHVRVMDKATPFDILGIFMSLSCYLLYLGSSRLKIINQESLENLFNILYDRAQNFCWKSKDEIDELENSDLEKIFLGYLSGFLHKIDDEYFFVPPIMRETLRMKNKSFQTFFITEFDKALSNNNVTCFTKIPYDEKGYKRFTRLESVRYNKLYNFIHFLLLEKRLILGFITGVEYHRREEKYEWLKKQIMM